VRIDRKGRALDHVVRVSKQDQEKVTWVAQGNGGPWKVTFDKDANGSPFSQTVYVIPQGGSVTTGAGPNPTTNVDETYRYNVRNATTDVITNDPDIDIDP
jgi:hypothetical protein